MPELSKLGLAFVLLQVTARALDTSTAFDILKGLQGKWVIRSAEKVLPIQMIYDVGSKGSIVTEQFGKELSVFYRDGEDLELIHFCNRGNQPRLRLKKESTPTVLDFEMVGITNLRDPEASHVRRIIYTIVDSKRIEVEIHWAAGVKPQEPEKYTLEKS